MEAISQLLLKSSATAKDASAQKAWWLAGGIACFAIEAVIWSCVLRMLDVAIAYPMGSLTFVTVTLFSWLFLKEKVTRRRWAGVALILVGTALVGLG
jgi:undecaprenyl phosphate-alpha-L-ara4N flippase subunit ArnE